MNEKSLFSQDPTVAERASIQLRSLIARNRSRNESRPGLHLLKEELRGVREQCLAASRRGDYVAQGRLTVQAAKLNQAIAEAEQVGA